MNILQTGQNLSEMKLKFFINKYHLFIDLLISEFM